MPAWRSWHRPLMIFAATMAVLTVVSGVGMIVDDRVLVGSPIWFKPFKFSLSLMIYASALASMLSMATRGRRAGWWAGTVVALTGAIEMVIIIGQVIRGRRSHFNYATAFDTLLFNIMGLTIITLWVSSMVIAFLLFRSRLADRPAAWAMRLGVAIALVGAGLGNLMTRPTPEQQAEGDLAKVIGSHNVGVPEGGPSMPLTGWSTTGGDLRIPHFVGMHALQLIPLFLLTLISLAPRFTRLRDERVRLRLVLVASGVYAAVLALLTWQALRGQALIHPDGATLTGAAAVLVAAAAGSFTALRTTSLPPTADDAEKEFVT